MSESYVKADFSGLEKLIKGLSKTLYTDVGILEGGVYDDGTTVAYVGAVHEFGTDKAGRSKDVVIPERSFIKMPLEEKADEIEKFVAKNIKKHLEEGNIEAIFEDIGVACDAKIQEAFETQGFGKWPANADSTIAQKGSSAPLIDDGTLRKSISWNVGGK
jgi:phage gpG-like protein